MVVIFFIFKDMSKIGFRRGELERRSPDFVSYDIFQCLRRNPKLHHSEAEVIKRGESILRFWIVFSKKLIVCISDL